MRCSNILICDLDRYLCRYVYQVLFVSVLAPWVAICTRIGSYLYRVLFASGPMCIGSYLYRVLFVSGPITLGRYLCQVLAPWVPGSEPKYILNPVLKNFEPRLI